MSLYGKETLFPSVFYDYPLLHICLFLFFAFCIGGLLAGVALALSGLLKNIFMVWVSVFVLNYLYESLVGIVCKNGAGNLLSAHLCTSSRSLGGDGNYRLW